MKKINLCLVGFGYVGRSFARLLQRKEKFLADRYGWEWQVTGIATGKHGMAIDPAGINTDRAIELIEKGESIQALSKVAAFESVPDFIRQCPADLMFENSPLNIYDGQPAISHIQAALEGGMHAITANKGPVAYAYRELSDLAEKNGKRFLFESAVMDGVPIFSLFRSSLPAAEVRGMSGILNSTTNLILERMENGESFEEAVRKAQELGIAEADPSADVDGWDAAVKLAVLATVIMNQPLTPQQVKRQGIREITPEMLEAARIAGERWKLVCRAWFDHDILSGQVAPERVKAGSNLYSINGTGSYIQFETDVLPGLGIVECDPDTGTTAYGLLADMINALCGAC